MRETAIVDSSSRVHSNSIHQKWKFWKFLGVVVACPNVSKQM